ncbi:MAG: GPW/gp25 family protein [Caldilineaceae bacterium]
MNTDFLGKGIAWPMRQNARGGITVSRHADKIKESIRIILGTERGTRLMRPTFGSQLHTLLFAPNNIATANLARHYVEEALLTWEPRILLEEVSVRNDHQSASLQISVRYQLKATREPQNLVYPFYLQQQ